MPLLVLLIGTVGGALVGIVVPLCLALGAVEDSSDRLFARGMAGGDVKELLGGPRTLATQLVDQGLAGGPRQEGVAESPNLMPLRSTRLPLDIKYSRNDTKSRGSVRHTPRENPKIHIFPLGSQIRE